MYFVHECLVHFLLCRKFSIAIGRQSQCRFRMASLNLPMKGQCFCNAIQYTLDASPIFVNCCHCRDCQQLTGSAFALNIMIEAGNVTVTSKTQPIVKAEEKPDKERSSGKSMHCSKCGIMLWATSDGFGDGLLFVRAGTLAENERIVPHAHFFVRSKHPWIKIPEGVKTFETLPEKGDAPLFTGKAKSRLGAATAR